MKKYMIRLAAMAAGLTVAVSGCSLDSASQSSGNVVNVVIGYQSKTINTVTAGTLLKAQGYLERRLNDITTRTGRLLMNDPTVRSASGRSLGRPETVRANTTSRWRHSCARAVAMAARIGDPTATDHDAARARRPASTPGASRCMIDARATPAATGPPLPRSVGCWKPCRAERQ